MIPGLTPTVFAMVQNFPMIPAEHRKTGIECMSAEDFRWKKAHIKSTSLLGSVMARQLSVDAELADTILFRGGYLSEASASNAWIVKDGAVIGVPRDHLVLEGIRYGLLQELCLQLGIPFELRKTSRKEVAESDELLLTSAVKMIVPVVRLHGAIIGKGRPGPIFARLFNAYLAKTLEKSS